MNTRKHLLALDRVLEVLLIICIAATIICLIAMIAGESPVPFICSILGCPILYLSRVSLNVIIDFYDAVVPESPTIIDDEPTDTDAD